MALTKERKAEVLNTYRLHERDTASPQVQVALLTERLNYLTEHFKNNEKDHHSRRGLMQLVSQRRQLLNYLNRNDSSAYKDLITKLGIRK